MLIGQYISKLTDKDRVSVPKRIREELGEELVVARWYENCLVLVSKDTWQRLLKRVTGGSNLVISPVRDVDRFILGLAFEVRLDKQGRFILPKALLEYADMKNEVVFIGLGDRVEVWAKNKWEELEKEAEEKASKAIERISRRKI